MDVKEKRIERIKARMNELGMNSRELAKRSGISESGISRILTGEIDPRTKTFMKIADALRSDYTWLMGYGETPDQTDKSAMIVDIFDSLDDAQKEKLLNLAKAIKEGLI